MEFPVNATLAAGLWFVQEQLGSLREKLYTDTVGTHVPHHDVHTELSSDITAPGSNSVIGLNLISKFVRGNIHTSVLLGIKSGVSAIRNAVDDTSTALKENSAHSNDSLDITLKHLTEQDLPDQQVLGETHDAGTQTNCIVYLTAMESELDPRLNKQRENNEAYVALPENNHNHRMNSLALTRFRPYQHNDLDLEHLIIDQGRQDASPDNHTNVLREINEENIRLRLQRDDLLIQRAALENDLSTSFIEKFDLQKQLSSANRTIEKGRAHYKRIDAEWKRDLAKLQDMIRLFEANTENARYVEMLRQQNVLEETNIWLSGQLQMRIEDHRFFACQRQAALQASSYHRACAMNSEIQLLRQWLSTVQAQLADTGKARARLEEELQQERLKHQEVMNAFYQEPYECSYPCNVQQTAYVGGSAPHKPSKFTPAYPTGFQSRSPKAGTPPQLSSDRKPVSNVRPDTWFEPCTASGSSTQQYSTRSKSKFTFGDNSDSQSASIATGTTTGATPRIDFNFSFRGTVDYHSSLGADGSTTEFDLPKYSTSQNGRYPANINVASHISAGSDQSTSTPSVGNCKVPLVEAENTRILDECDHGEDEETEEYMQDPCLPSGGSCLASELPPGVKDKVNLFGDLQPQMAAENMVPCNSTKAAHPYVNRKTQNRSRKPLASDFFHTDSVKAEVEMNSMNALPAEKTSEEKVHVVFAGAAIAQLTHIGGGVGDIAAAEGSVQAGEGNETMEAEQGSNPLSPLAAFKGFPKSPKNKGRTQRRAFLRKIAKARKLAEIVGTSGKGTS